MKKWLHFSVFLISLFFLVSCENQEGKLALTPASNQTETAVPTATTAATPTAASTSTSTSIPTKAPTPEPTISPYIVWSDTLRRVHIEGEISQGDYLSNIGSWANTINAFLYQNRTEEGITLYKASAPDFEPVALINNSPVEFFTWSPDSRSVLYTYYVSPADGRLGIIGADGGNPHEINSRIRSVHWLSPLGWMDANNFLYTNYAGGGHLFVDSVNIQNGTLSSWSGFIHGNVYPPQNGYIPAFSDDSNLQANLLAISGRFSKRDLPGGDGGIGLGGNILLLPEYQSIPRTQTLSTFESWVPNRNAMLVFWLHMDPATGKFLGPDLLLWNLDNNSVNLAVPNGLGGNYSPDGMIFAYITSGPAILDRQSRPVENKQVSTEHLPEYLQLQEKNSDKVFLSLPIVTSKDMDDDLLFERYYFLADFSPDSHYLAFLTRGKVQTNPDGWPISVDSGSASLVSINLLDLQEKKLVWSTASSEKAAVSWSPKSEYFVYSDQGENWQLFDIQNQTSTRLTIENGTEAFVPAWSFDGKYLSFISCQPSRVQRCEDFIDILDVTMAK